MTSVSPSSTPFLGAQKSDKAILESQKRYSRFHACVPFELHPLFYLVASWFQIVCFVLICNLFKIEFLKTNLGQWAMVSNISNVMLPHLPTELYHTLYQPKPHFVLACTCQRREIRKDIWYFLLCKKSPQGLAAWNNNYLLCHQFLGIRNLKVP